jgi:hypothetical protein
MRARGGRPTGSARTKCSDGVTTRDGLGLAVSVHRDRAAQHIGRLRRVTLARYAFAMRKRDEGPIGPIGPTGPTGPIGPQGLQGIPGVVGALDQLRGVPCSYGSLTGQVSLTYRADREPRLKCVLPGDAIPADEAVVVLTEFSLPRLRFLDRLPTKLLVELQVVHGGSLRGTTVSVGANAVVFPTSTPSKATRRDRRRCRPRPLRASTGLRRNDRDWKIRLSSGPLRRERLGCVGCRQHRRLRNRRQGRDRSSGQRPRPRRGSVCGAGRRRAPVLRRDLQNLMARHL